LRREAAPELIKLLEGAGFQLSTAFALNPTPQSLVVSLAD